MRFPPGISMLVKKMEKQRTEEEVPQDSIRGERTGEEYREEAVRQFSALYEVVHTLRGEGGCPWDRAQTHESLKPYLIEEAYETVDAVNAMKNGNGCEALKEELGDLLFQILLYSEIACQEGMFSFGDVAAAARDKMIYRHPNVFPDADGKRRQQNWEKLKREERPEETPQEEMERIPHCFPALMRTQKIQKKMTAYDGAEKTTAEAVRTAETLLEAFRKKNAGSKEAGALLYEICRILGAAGIHAEQALKDTVEEKLETRRKRN